MRASTALACLVGVGAMSAGCTLLNSGDDLLVDSGVRPDSPMAPADAFAPDAYALDANLCSVTGCDTDHYCAADGRCVLGVSVIVEDYDGAAAVVGDEIIALDEDGVEVGSSVRTGSVGDVQIAVPIGGAVQVTSQFEVSGAMGPDMHTQTTRYEGIQPGVQRIRHLSPQHASRETTILPMGTFATGCTTLRGESTVGPECETAAGVYAVLTGSLESPGFGILDTAGTLLRRQTGLRPPLVLTPMAPSQTAQVWAGARAMVSGVPLNFVPMLTNDVILVLSNEDNTEGWQRVATSAVAGDAMGMIFTLPALPTPPTVTRTGDTLALDSSPDYYVLVQGPENNSVIRVLPGSTGSVGVESRDVRISAWFDDRASTYADQLAKFGNAPHAGDQRSFAQRTF